MTRNGPYHRTGEPGGQGCRVGILPIQGRKPGGELMAGALLDAGTDASEVELLRTVAHGLGVVWGKDDLGWWAVVPDTPASEFAQSQATRFGLYRQDDNAVVALIETYDTQSEAEEQAAEFTSRGHKQFYFVRQMD